MLLPERTVDVWSSLAIHRLAPAALFWAPTTNMQALSQPWDLKAHIGAKMILLENKGLDDQAKVRLPIRQLLRLVYLQHVAGAKLVHYGLPDPSMPRALALAQPHFGMYLWAATPRQLLTRIVGAGLKPLGLGSASPYFRFDPGVLNLSQTLDDLVALVLACKQGVRFTSRGKRTPVELVDTVVTTLVKGPVQTALSKNERDLYSQIDARPNQTATVRSPAVAVIPILGPTGGRPANGALAKS